MIETLFGFPAENAVEVDCQLLGINGMPLGKAATISDRELEANICKIVKLRMEGNPEIEKYFESHPASDEPRNSRFVKRLAEIAEEWGSPLAAFLRAYVEDSQPAMRAAVRQLLRGEGGWAVL